MKRTLYLIAAQSLMKRTIVAMIAMMMKAASAYILYLLAQKVCLVFFAVFLYATEVSLSLADFSRESSTSWPRFILSSKLDM